MRFTTLDPENPALEPARLRRPRRGWLHACRADVARRGPEAIEEPPASVGAREHRDRRARPIPFFERGKPDTKRFGHSNIRGGPGADLAVDELRWLVGG